MRPALGGVGLIVFCFFGSAALRLTDDGWALAQGLGEPAARAARHAASGADSAALLAAIASAQAQLDAEEARLADRKQSLERRRGQAHRAARGLRQGAEEPREDAGDGRPGRGEGHRPDDHGLREHEARGRGAIFERMDVNFAAGLLARMRPDVAAKVLTGMKRRNRLRGDADHREPQRRGANAVAPAMRPLKLS